MNSDSEQKSLKPIHTSLKNEIQELDIELVQKFLSSPQESFDDESLERIKITIQKSFLQFQEESLKEPLSYLATSRRGLRKEDLCALMGSDWKIETFLNLNECFGAPFVNQIQNILFLAVPGLYKLIFELLSDEDKNNYQADIAFHLLKLPINDPVRETETLYHLLQCDHYEEAIEFFIHAQDGSLMASADTIGGLYVKDEKGKQILEKFINVEINKKFILWSRLLNEVFVSLIQHVSNEQVESFIDTFQTKQVSIMGERNSIDNILLMSLIELRKSILYVRKKDEESVRKYYESSLGSLDQLFKQNPPVSELSWENCDSIFKMGMICLEMRQPKGSQLCFDILFKLFEEKLKDEPSDSMHRMYFASCVITICRFCEQIQDKEIESKYFSLGKPYLLAALKQKSSLAAQNPGLTMIEHDLMFMYNDFGDLCCLNAQYEDAQRAYDNALIIGERLAANNKQSVEMLIAPSVTFDRLGKMYVAMKDLKQAESYFLQSLELRKMLAKEHPNDFRLLNDLAGANHNLAGLFLQKSQNQLASPYLEGQLEAIRKSLALQPQSEQAVISLLDATFALGDNYYVCNDFTNAINAYLPSLNSLNAFIGKQVSEPMLNRIAGIHFKIGSSQLQLKFQKEAYEHLEIASDLWKQLSDVTKNPIYKTQQEKVQNLLNNAN